MLLNCVRLRVVAAVLAAWPLTAFPEVSATSGNRVAMAREQLEELRVRSSALATHAATDPALAAYTNDLAHIDALARGALDLITTAEVAAAEAWVDMACYAAWIVSRESKKKAASLRLIEITRATGKADEVERYQARHEMLLGSIDDAVDRYRAILSELGGLSEQAVERGFALHRQQLAERGLPVREEVLEKVREHLVRAAEGGEGLAETCQRELETL